MNEIRKKIILDLCVTPTTIGTGSLGVSLLLISWAIGASAIWPFLGFISILIGIGAIATNWLFNLEAISKKAVETLRDQAEAAQDLKLDELDELLCRDRDPRDQGYLRDLRAIYDELKEDVAQGKLSKYVTPDTLVQLEELFQACVKSLRYSYDLWESSKAARGGPKNKILQERENVLTEIGKSVERFTENVTTIRSLSHKTQNGDLSKLRTDLDRSLEIARRTEAEMRDISVDEKYKEFLQ
jgi:hypothetical protein